MIRARGARGRSFGVAGVRWVCTYFPQPGNQFTFDSDLAYGQVNRIFDVNIDGFRLGISPLAKKIVIDAGEANAGIMVRTSATELL